jgi:hypothetical protein
MAKEPKPPAVLIPLFSNGFGANLNHSIRDALFACEHIVPYVDKPREKWPRGWSYGSTRDGQWGKHILMCKRCAHADRSTVRRPSASAQAAGN